MDTFFRARKRVEDRLNRFGLRKMGKKRDGSIEDTSGGCEFVTVHFLTLKPTSIKHH